MAAPWGAELSALCAGPGRPGAFPLGLLRGREPGCVLMGHPRHWCLNFL